ncbi:MAG: hypothetical protein H6661_09030 [Ardenticatenaceae bacterium]|nr:hypothetical protein [Ardenticatenaceae bacterium]
MGMKPPEFLQRATCRFGSAVSAKLLLAACTLAGAEDTLLPVVDSVQPDGGTALPLTAT